LIESLPDDEAKSVDAIAQDILQASSYLLNMYCKPTDISNRDCVKFMSKYSLPDTRLSTKCTKMTSNHKGYRRMLPASYKDGLQKVNKFSFNYKWINFNLLINIFKLKIQGAISGKELPLPRLISSVLFASGLDDIKRQSANKLRPVSIEGILDRKLTLSVAQWTQFIEHDLSKTVARSMGEFHLIY
jgi:peroxidase